MTLGHSKLRPHKGTPEWFSKRRLDSATLIGEPAVWSPVVDNDGERDTSPKKSSVSFVR